MISFRLLLLRALSRIKIVDAAYYRQKNEDVARANLDPNYHYFKYGIKEGRHPNHAFERFANWRYKKTTRLLILFFLDDAFYLSIYRDAQEEGLTAADHFTLKGRKEKRHLNKFNANLSGVLYFIRSEIVSVSGDAIAREKEIQEQKYRLFESAGRGFFDVWKARAISRSISKSNSTDRLLVSKINTLEIAHLSKFNHHVEDIEPAYLMAFQEPKIFDSEKARPPRAAEVPSKWIATLKNASVVGGFQVIASNHLVIYEPAANPHQGFVAGIWPYVASLNQKNEVLVWFRYQKEITLPAAILLSGRCSPNYYHWLIEYLGKSHLLVKLKRLQKIPLIVDAGMFPQEFDSLQAMLPDWPIYRHDNSTLLKVGKLYIPSSCTNLTDNLRGPMWQFSAICFKTLAHMQSTVYERLGIQAKPVEGRKIFLARRAGRNITNTPEVEDIVTSFGYEITDTAQLSFEQQVRLFAEARIIVGAMGAAFTNLIFCRPGTQVLALSSPYTQLFCSQSNMALFAGCYYQILVGEHPLFQPGDEHTVSDPSLFLDSYAIDPQQLTAALTNLEAQASS